MNRARGPAVSRLADYVRGAEPEHLSEAAESWMQTVRDLNDTRATLRWAARLVEEKLSGDYATSATRHLDQLAEVTIDRQREVRQAARVLQASSDALYHAEQVMQDARAAEASGGQVDVVTRMWSLDPYGEEAIERDRYRAQQARHDERTFDDHEQRAAAETSYLDHVFEQTSDKMREVERTRGADLADGGRYDIDEPVRPEPPEPRHPLPPEHHVEHPGHPVGEPPLVTGHPGTPQGPGATAPVTAGPGAGPASTGSTGHGVPSASLALGAGGLGAAALGGLRAGGVSVPGLSSQGVRGIGGSGSGTGGTGTRSGGAGARSGGTGAGTGTRSGAAGGRAGAGGSAGGRQGRSGRAGARTGAAGRAGRRKDEDRRDQREGIDEDPEQWLEDDDTAPRVMSGSATGALAWAVPATPVTGVAPDLDPEPDADLEAELDTVLDDLGLDDEALDDVDLAGWLEEPAPERDAPAQAPAATAPTAPREGPPTARHP